MPALALLLILGTLQGLTEFLPVSSSAHLVLGLHWLPGAAALSDPETVVVWLHLGTLLAVITFYRRRLAAMTGAVFGFGQEVAAQRRTVLLLAAATVPAVVAALTAGDFIDSLFENPAGVGAALLVTGMLLFGSAYLADRGRAIPQLSLAQALFIGLVQMIAIMPGISRSGSTIVGGLLVGLSLENATHFSFLMSIPAILGAVLFDLGDAVALLREHGELRLPLLAGAAASFLVGYLSLGFLLWIARARRLSWFAPYCWLLGAVALFVSLKS